MAVLTSAKRKELWAEFMQKVSERREPLGALTKSELRDALNAIDVWVDDNAALFNAALPQPARSEVTAKQKAELFMFVVSGRFDVS